MFFCRPSSQTCCCVPHPSKRHRRTNIFVILKSSIVYYYRSFFPLPVVPCAGNGFGQYHRTHFPAAFRLAATSKGESMGTTYGYVRVSSTDQNTDRQYLALQEQGIPEECIFIDRISGKDFRRPRYGTLLSRLRSGDLLCITSIDRLGRNYEEIQEQWRLLTREMAVDILVLDMPLLDTRRDRDLLGTFIADLVLQVLSFIAQNERESIRRRQAEGIAAARLRGIRFGRDPRPLPHNFIEIYELWKTGDISATEAAKRCGMARSTFRYRAKSINKTTG